VRGVRIALLAWLILIMSGVIGGTAHAAKRFKEFSVPTPTDLAAITAGPDGNLWFTETNGLVDSRQDVLEAAIR